MAQTPTLWRDLGFVNANDVGPGGDEQREPVITALADGGFVVVWEDLSRTGPDTTSNNIKFQRFDALGNAVGSETTVGLVNGEDESSPDVALLSNGNFVISFTRDVVADGRQAAFTAEYSADGVLLGEPLKLSDGAFGGDFIGTRLTTGDNNAFMIASFTDSINSTFVFGRDENGANFNLVGTGTSRLGDAVFLDDGTYRAISMIDSPLGVGVGGSDLLIQSNTGNAFIALGSEVINDLRAATLSNGNYVIVYDDSNGSVSDTSGSSIEFRVLNAGGNTQASGTVNTTTFGGQFTPEVTVLENFVQGFVVTWFDNGSIMRAQVFNNDGTKVGSEFTLAGASAFNNQPAVTELSDGRIAFTYRDADDGIGGDIIVKILDPRDTSTLNGTSEADVITARFIGNSTINGLGGDDRLLGLDGNDTLNGGTGSDRMEGGSGDDTYFIDGFGDRIIEAAGPGGGTDIVISSTLSINLNRSQLNGVENATLFGSGNFALIGDGGDNRLVGNNGNGFVNAAGGSDTIFGRGGVDTVFAGSGDDDVRGEAGNDRLNGQTGNDRLFGGADNDLLRGGADNDTLRGDAGRDRLEGQTGNDRLYGGADKDTFVFTFGVGRDVIFDFTTSGATRDRIDLRKVSQISDFDDLMDNHVIQSGADVLIRIDAQNSIRIKTEDIADLDRFDFLF